MTPGRAWIAASVLALAACSHRPHSTRAGVYSAPQAARGKDLYAGMCVSCHAGMGNHTGPIFRAFWGGSTLLRMYRFISENMPKNDPGSLQPDEYVAIMAYLLQMNGMPAGTVALETDTTTLKAIVYDTAAATH